MTTVEYKNKLAELANEYEAKKRKVITEYALSNNPYKVGDMITDHSSTIKIEKIQPYLGYNELPICLYTGTQYTKKGEISKKQDYTKIYQRNIINPLKPNTNEVQA